MTISLYMLLIWLPDEYLRGDNSTSIKYKAFTYVYAQVEMNPQMLNNEIGSAKVYATLSPSDTEMKAKYKENIKKYSLKLATLSGLVHLRCSIHSNSIHIRHVICDL